MSYIIITPVKNERKFISSVIESILAQTELPVLWVIVDGCSTDGTRNVIQEYSRQYPWIELLLQTRFGRTPHESVSMAVHDAYEYIKSLNVDYDYIWTIDGDQILNNNVCKNIIKECQLDNRIGAASCTIFNGGKPDTYPSGEISNKRVYPKSVIDDIGGFPITKYCYDTAILAKIRIGGYKIVSFPQYSILNHRADSGIERNDWKSHVTFGRARWYIGYSIPLVIAGCGYLVLKMQIKKAIGIFYGYIVDRIKNEEQIPDESIKHHFKYDRLKQVLNGK